MTDESPGSGWWQASDGKWYPPHLHPDAPYVSEPPRREPIDWERVAAERDHRRRAANARRQRRIAGAVLVSLGALAVLVGVATNRSGGSPLDDTALSTDTTSTSTFVGSTTTTTSEPPATTTTLRPGVTLVSVFDLEPGMCIDNPELSSGLVTDLAEISCDEPHSHEVFFATAFEAPDDAFDAEAVATFAAEQCSEQFAAYVGVSYDRSKYYYLHLAPSAESWDEQDDRDVVCLLFQQGATLTGTAQDSAE